MRTSRATIAIVLSLAAAGSLSAGGALAQERPLTSDEGSTGAGARSDHITATGQTVPNPGVSQGAGTTDMDRGIQRDDNKIQSSICKGC